MMILILTILLSGSVFAVDCEKDSIYCHIVDVSPTLNKSHVMKISDIVYKQLKKAKLLNYKKEYAALLVHENQLRNKDTYKRVETVIDNTLVIEKKVVDVGIAQINVRTIRDYKLDIDRIRNDVNYAISSSVKIFKKKISVCLTKGVPESEAWACYHSYTPEIRLVYLNLVKRYMTL